MCPVRIVSVDVEKLGRWPGLRPDYVELGQEFDSIAALGRAFGYPPRSLQLRDKPLRLHCGVTIQFTDVPVPTRQEIRDECVRLLESGDPATIQRAALRAAFAVRFGLVDEGRQNCPADRMYRTLQDAGALRDVERLFDHRHYFRRENTAVLVTQPYGLGRAEDPTLHEWAARFGIVVSGEDEWSFHYPGQTSLIMFELDLPAVRRLGVTAYRTQRKARREENIAALRRHHNLV
jgi:hypothetical protein